MLKIRTHSLSWLLLALIALRGLVPTGYMIDATQEGVSIVVCDSGIYKDSAPTHHPHHHDQGSGKHDHSICPFAVAATSGPTPSLPLAIFDAAGAVDRIHSVDEFPAGLSGPSRAQQPRAPPS